MTPHPLKKVLIKGKHHPKTIEDAANKSQY
jgi:hypothetical protein